MTLTFPVYIVKYILSDNRVDYDTVPLFGTLEHQLIAFTDNGRARAFYNEPFNQTFIQGLGATAFEIVELDNEKLDALINELSKSHPITYLWLNPTLDGDGDGYDYHSGMHVRIREHSLGQEGEEPDEIVLTQLIAAMKQKITQMEEQVKRWETLLARITARTLPASLRPSTPQLRKAPKKKAVKVATKKAVKKASKKKR